MTCKQPDRVVTITCMPRGLPSRHDYASLHANWLARQSGKKLGTPTPRHLAPLCDYMYMHEHLNIQYVRP
jgi:hypothetical protein